MNIFKGLVYAQLRARREDSIHTRYCKERKN